MALNIHWTTKADIKLDHLIIYLENEWGERVVKAFMRKLYDFLEIVSEFPDIGTLEYPKRNIRGFVLTKHVTVFYKVDEDKIILLDLFDNRSNPKRRKSM